MKFGIMFFASSDQEHGYQLLLDAAQFADECGFTCVWTPERHFHHFGGLFPNPAVTSTAIAMVTKQIKIRAGSVISPLHDVIRIVEEWACVDRLSGGRVGISFGAGWNTNDFIFFPDRFEKRHDLMFNQVERIKAMWRGEAITRMNGVGREVTVLLHPSPIQKELPIWITATSSSQTFSMAGAIGANILTHLIGQDLSRLSEKVGVYKESLKKHGHQGKDTSITVMLHTSVGDNNEDVKARVKMPLSRYLRSAVNLEYMAAHGGGTVSGGHRLAGEEPTEGVLNELTEIAFERYFESAALLGSTTKCESMIRQLASIGVNEVACLVDFGLNSEEVLSGLRHLDFLRQRCAKIGTV